MNNISADTSFMKIVYITAARSKDRTKIGSVIIKNGSIISSGFNGFPRGVIDQPKRLENRTIKYRLIVHSEENAICNAARLGVSTYGGILYTQTYPCCECAKSIAQSGIMQVVVHQQFGYLSHTKKWENSVKYSKIIFNEANVSVRIFDQFLGMDAFIDGKIVKV